VRLRPAPGAFDHACESADQKLKGTRPRVDDVGEKAMQPDGDHNIQERPPVPSGAGVEITRDGTREAAGGTPSPDRLHVCFHCAGELAFPLDWCEEGPRHWRIIIRCPDCESLREGVFEQTAVESLDDELDRGASALLADLKRITHANMTDEIEFFVRALDADLIVPSDF
jgi:hypothetical protein